ncbi:MAG TPA: 5-oxoprolinase subunit PxpB [Chloroflexota bacterium]|nr:5-oxoprolinase subunit PxpB [Chloroflexota bacterium]
MDDDPPSVRSVGDGALLIEFGAPTAATAARARALARRVREARWPGVYDVVPAYRTVLVRFDPCTLEAEHFPPRAASLLQETDEPEDSHGKVVEIPVCYGGEHGPDLEDVARHAGLSAGEVVRLHAAGEYRVEFLGFSPGFPFHSGLHPALATPRLATPRTRVPAGSVGIGSAQTGFYTMESPGGWRLIGRIPALHFDRARPDTLPYAPGDTIRFMPIDQQRYEALAGTQRNREPAQPSAPRAAVQTPAGAPALRVVRAGPLATVQDRGRSGLGALGYGTAGAMDHEALRIANALVGNDPDAAAIELTLDGGEFEAIGDLTIAIAGADLAPSIDEAPAPHARACALRAGMRLRFGARRTGLRAYLAVAGGIALPAVLGSRATDLVAQLGGLDGRALRTGDVLPIHMTGAPGSWALDQVPLPRAADELVVRVVWGPQDDWFDEATRQRFSDAAFAVSARSDRTGLRLEGTPVMPARRVELSSEGVVPGAIQVPADGNPIVLLADGRSIGGYPKIATVISADLHRLGQVTAGTRLRFSPVTAAEAREAARAWEARLRQVPLRPAPEPAVRCLLEVAAQTWRCPRTLACLVARRCLRVPMDRDGVIDRGQHL